ncbi:hypothetical protein J437_LFUL010553 [Ladona fulva]|uniref:Glycoside hydrolase 35 catalytic domain-containing protein n=1 Tax=Ladona fulva TaxID=123851 RepID=A0A8K0KFC2_LADFU|nr:hypothetical protein J437_LFUL010553 [Ladona fulva]
MSADEASLPTLYEYYTEGGISSSLEAPATGFKLNGKDITIFSGAVHYFRVHSHYWRDRLRKLRAAGLNTVETYIPWNLHETEEGVFDFGNGSREFSAFLDFRSYIKIAQEEDLFVIIRPGPYICSEWDFGGLPSWLLRNPGIKVRTSDPNFTSRVRKYLDQLLPHFVDLQFSKGGSIIAFQIENEYGGFGEVGHPRDKEYLRFIKTTFEQNGLVELFVTSDTPRLSGDSGALPGVLQTANFNTAPESELNALKELQPDKAVMVMEFWSGWFDHWMEGSHQTGLTKELFEEHLEVIFNFNASINVYMFHGGTSFGFMNGANSIPIFPYYAPDVSSYDYDAPLSEAGDYTEKYRILEKVISKYNKVLTRLPNKPEESKKFAYRTMNITQFLEMDDIIEKIDKEDKVFSDSIISMESLNINNGNGQSYGFINYRKNVTLCSNSCLKITGHVRDIVMLSLDGKRKTGKLTSIADLLGFGYWPNR